MNSLSVFFEHIFEAASQSGKSVEDCLRFAKGCGIDYLECDLWRLEQKNEVKALFDRCGMRVSSIYSHFDFIHDSAQQSAEKYTKLFETAKYFGADKVLCIPGFLTEDRGNQMDSVIARLNEMCAAAKEYGITVTLEDFDDITSPCCRMDDILFLMQSVDGLKYTFDTGNFRYCLEDAAEAYEKLKDYVVHAHLKDRSYDTANANADLSNGKADLSGAIMYPAEVCGGVIGIDKLLKRLKADGYSGILAIEHFGASDQLNYMKKSAENIRTVLEEA